MSEIENAKYFWVILDTTPDVSHIDQLAFSVRYVKNGKPIERFLCFEEMSGLKSVDFLHKLQELVTRYGLDVNLIRGQAMDGCSTIPGINRGLQALVHKTRPSALYVHCMAHHLNLVLVKAASSCVPVKSLFGSPEKMYSFFVASPKKISQFHSSQKSLGKKRKCQKVFEKPVGHHKLMLLYMQETIECYMDALECLIADNNLEAKGLSDAWSLLTGMKIFEFLVLLYFWLDILVIAKAATDEVQGPCLNINISSLLIQTCVKQFSTMRENEDHFNEILESEVKQWSWFSGMFSRKKNT